jgi:hypothetical protein
VFPYTNIIIIIIIQTLALVLLVTFAYFVICTGTPAQFSILPKGLFLFSNSGDGRKGRVKRKGEENKCGMKM